MSGNEPRYDPDAYNKDPRVQDAHNCFDYGLNVIDDEQTRQCDGKPTPCEPLFHQPGGTKGLSDILQKKEGRTCKVVDQLMREDVPELKPTTFTHKCPDGTSKIALVVHPGEDYHFYRQDDDGWWSHKDGSNKVKRYDAEGHPIWNPQTAARDYRPKGSFLNYRDFCGFYCAPRRRTIKLAKGGSRRAKGGSRRAKGGSRRAKGGSRRAKRRVTTGQKEGHDGPKEVHDGPKENGYA